MSSDQAHVIESEFRPGQVFAERYKITDLLSSRSGSMIYRVVDQTTNLAVALKLICSPAIARQPDVLTRYRLDLNSMRQIVHENVVRIFDFGEYAGHLYLTMELVEGETLGAYLDHTGKLTVSEFLRLLPQLSESLTQLHARHIVHRDLHPGNLIITYSGCVKLMDFGFDRDLKHIEKINTQRNIGYAAPEQFAAGPPAIATDIYSLGAICYTMLTGQRPQGVVRPSDSGSWCSPEQLRQNIRDLPAGLAQILSTCLQRDPDKRYRDAGALQRAISDLQDDNAVQENRIRLDSLIKNHPTEPDTCTRLFLGILARLREMHAANLPHAELSPQKVWLQGSEVEIESASAPAAQATLLIPDAKYSAPELLMAQTAPDKASHLAADVYILGFVLYEFLAGRTRMEQQFAELARMRSGLGWMRWHVEPDKKLQPLATLLSNFPDALSELVERMVEKNPSQRIRSLDQVEAQLSALRARLDHTDQFVADLAAPAPICPPAHKPARRPRVAPLAAAVAVAVSLAVAGWWLTRGGRHSLLGKEFARLHSPATVSALGASVASAVHSSPAATPPQVAQTSTGVMLLIPAGEFVMGDNALPNAAPARKVSLPAFYLDRVEVSNLAYRKFSREASRPLPSAPVWDLTYFAKNEYPVINVTWENAKAFCESAGKRLPTEAEWEKAARGTESFTHWANWTLPGLANLQSVAGRRPAPVGSFPADISPYGVLDLAGNVQEWVDDSYLRSDSTAKASAGVAVNSRRVVRGGSYATNADSLSPSWRGQLADGGSGPVISASVGFRCAADPAQIAGK